MSDSSNGCVSLVRGEQVLVLRPTISPMRSGGLMMCSVSQLPRTLSLKLEASSPAVGSRAPKSCWFLVNDDKTFVGF